MSAHSTSLARPASTGLFVGWWVLMALLPIGHITGLRNSVTVVVVVATLVLIRHDAWKDLPARWLLLGLLAWCASSIAWSTVPSVSFSKWKTDLLIPLVAYAAAFGYVRRTGAITALIGGAATSVLLLGLLSMTAFLSDDSLHALRTVVDLEDFANVSHPLPWWYPGVGDASMAATFVAGTLGVMGSLRRSVRAWWLAVTWMAVVVVVFVANNRSAQVALFVAVAFGVWCARRRSTATHAEPRPVSRRGIAIALAAAVVTCVAFGGVMESSARERLRALGVPAAGGSAFLTLTMRDTRPMIWAYYANLAARSPLVGVGFGRTVPGIHYGTENDRGLAVVESNAYIHAHNIVLNWWLQTGIVGVLLLVSSLVLIVRDVARAGLRSTTSGYGRERSGCWRWCH